MADSNLQMSATPCRVVIAWEMGGNLGHLTRCASVSEALQRQGLGTLLALRETSPIISHTSSTWIVLAARLAGLPHAAIENGFAVPPPVMPWPSIRPFENISDARLNAAEDMLDESVSKACRALGFSTPPQLRDVYGSRDLLDTFAELDHYGFRPHARHIGPIHGITNALPLRWLTPDKPKIIVYLRASMAGFDAVLAVLRKNAAEIVFVAPDITPAHAYKLANGHCRISRRPVALA